LRGRGAERGGVGGKWCLIPLYFVGLDWRLGCILWVGWDERCILCVCSNSNEKADTRFK